MNGAKVVKWIQTHGMSEYAMIGLSGTSVDNLEPAIKRYFITGNARYFDKGEIADAKQDFILQVIYNRGFHSQISDRICQKT